MKNVLLKLWLKNGKEVKYHTKDKIARIWSKASLAEFKKAYLYVGYGRKIDNYGKLSEFHNDGYADNKKDLKSLISYFWHEE